jgi:putative DNA primase/helicase
MVVTLHATYLTPDGSGKAPVPKPKKVLGCERGATKGAALRLHAAPDAEGRLGVTEGIENALTLSRMKSVPVWAAFCADNLPRLALPPLRVLYIGVDIDEHGKGERAAWQLARRVRREQNTTEVLLVVPEGEGPRDLNDELRRGR